MRILASKKHRIQQLTSTGPSSTWRQAREANNRHAILNAKRSIGNRAVGQLLADQQLTLKAPAPAPARAVQRVLTDRGVKVSQDISQETAANVNQKTYWGEKLSLGYDLVLEHMDEQPVAIKNGILGGVSTKLPPQPPSRGGEKTSQLLQVSAGSPAINHAVFFKVIPVAKEESDPDAKPQLSVNWLGSSQQLEPSEIGPVPKDGDSSQPEDLYPRFANTPEEFYQTHREEKQRLYYWFNTQADTSAGFVKTLRMTTTVKEGETENERTSVFIVRYTNEGLEGKNLEFFYQGSSSVPIGAAPAGSEGKTGATLEIEQLQAHSTDRIGQVDLTGVPTEERAIVEFAIARYFTDSRARATEVDAVIPTGRGGNWINYTLVFDTATTEGVKTTDVKAHRIGPGVAPSEETQAAALDIRKVNGYPTGETDGRKLSAWITKRYKSITIAGETPAEIIAEANEQMAEGAQSEGWFTRNYGIHVLSRGDLATRLAKHGIGASQVKGALNMTAEELTHLELSLQQYSAAMLANWEDLYVGRQVQSPTKGGDAEAEAYHAKGLATIVLYDGTFDKEVTFGGGPDQIVSESVITIAHELGHIAEYKDPEVKRLFYDFVRAEGVKPFTWYSKEKATEFFAEAFSLYYSDPLWMNSYHPKLHAWFKAYDETGSPPV